MANSASNEEERLRVLVETGSLSAAPIPILDEICQEAKHYLDVPIALVTLVDRHKLLVKAAQGLSVSELPRDTAFCTYTILSDRVLTIPDMLVDEQFRHNPLVVGEPYLRFYAGAPLRYLEDIRLGSLCILDMKPRTFSPGDKAELEEMADRVVAAIAAQELKALETAATGLLT
jgi:GAF domain-containing protein